MSAPAAEALLTLIGEACEHLRALRTQPGEPASLVERYCEQLDNIATTAELAGMADVEHETVHKIAALRELGGGDPDRLAEEFAMIERWANALYESLQLPRQGDTESHAQPLRSEPDEQADAITGNTLLQALAEELRDNIEGLPAAMYGQSNAIVPAQLALVQRFRIACETLGMQSLREAFAFLEDNLNQLQHQTLSAAQTELLSRWPQQVLHYLDQGDDEAAATFIDVLEAAAWPQPLQESAAKVLLFELADPGEQPIEVAAERLTTATAEHVSLQLPDDLTPELLDAFFQESPAQAAELGERLRQLATGNDIANNLRNAQRLAHTLKGAGNLIGASGVANIAHYLEDILDLLPPEGASVSSTLGDVLLDAADCLETMLDALQGHGQPPHNALAVLQRVLDCVQSPEHKTLIADDRVAADDAVDTNADVQPPSEVTQYMRVATDTVDEMFRMAGEVTIGMAQIQDRIQHLLREGDGLRNQEVVLQSARLELENQVGVRSMAAAQRRTHSAAEDGFDSLELDRYDALYGSAHAFIEAAVDLREMSMDLQAQLQRLDALFGTQQRLNGELQDLILGTRMVPVRTISGRLQRAVRQAGRTLGRNVNFRISGEDLLLDNDVLRAIADPLMHVLRNAVDHGIETAAERAEAGKPAAGGLHLAFRQEGNHVIVRVSDDGRGIDYAALREIGIARGLLDAHGEDEPSQLRRLMLIPGVSTRSSVTQVSGRGVGMDAVYASVTALNGTLEIFDNEPHGCVVQLRLPVTLIANHCLLVEIAGARMAVPSYTLERIVAAGAGELTTLSQALRYELGKDVYPARYLHDLLNAGQPTANDNELAVVLVNVDQDIIAVAADRVLESRELVVKGMGRYVASVPGVTGVSVLGDGSVVPVLDLPALLRAPLMPAMASPQSSQFDARARARRVLIVDDSLSVRRALAALAEDSGYSAYAARDGLEAIKVLEEHHIDVVLADLEMPRLNGLELTQYMRADEAMRHVPVIMITSRGMGKHRRRAEAAGVNAYLNKPVANDELVALIDKLVDQRRVDASAA